jgi:hypothetical protein
MAELGERGSFYLIVGSAAGALMALLLLFVGIHKAWDAIVCQVMVYRADPSLVPGGA